MVCPGSVKHLVENPTEPSAAAADGTKTHELAEAMLKFMFGWSDKEPVRPGDDDKVEQARYDRAMWYASIVNGCADDLQKDAGEVDVAIESRFNLSHWHPDLFGTNDAAVWSDMHTLHVLDLKDGSSEVRAEFNPQLLYYALGTIEKNGLDVGKVVLHICQPKLNNHDIWEVPDGYMQVFKEQLIVAAQNVVDNPDLKNPDPVACKWCNKLKCPALKEELKKEAAVAFDDDPLSVDVSNYSVDRLAKIVSWAPILTKVVKDANAILYRMAMDGEEIPGKKLVRKQGNRKWINPEQVEKSAKKLGVTKAQMFKRSLLSPNQMVEAGADKDVVASLVERPDNGLALVDAADKGEAVKPGLPFGEEEEII